jgi:hypothetical protein
MKKAVFIFAAFLSLPYIGFAQEEAPVEATVEEKESFLDKLPFEIHGAVDAYVKTNFIPKVTNDVYNEAFPNRANSFNLGMINLMMSKQVGKVGFMADVAFGPRAENANGVLFNTIKQLYVTYSPKEWVTLTMGNFSTFFGYELIESQNNFNYSTSLAFQNGPFFHTGLKANFTKDKFNFLVALMNDTDSKIDDDRNKYVGAQVGYTGDNGGVYLNYVGGNEPADGLDKYYKNSVDITGSIKLGEAKKGKLGLNAALHNYTAKVGDEKEGFKYYVTYLYGQVDINETFSVGGRFGYLGNGDGVAPYVKGYSFQQGEGEISGVAKSYLDFTLTSHVNIGPLRLIPEFRIDYADEKVFFNKDGAGSNIQPTMTLAAVYAF